MLHGKRLAWKLSGAVEPTAEMRAQRRGSRCFEVEVQGSKTNWGKKTAQLLQGISVSWTNFHVRGPAKSEPNSLQLSFFPVLKLLKKHIHFSFHDSKATFLKASWFQTQSDTAKCWVAVKNWWTWTLGKLGKVNRLVNMKTKEDMCTAMYELNQQKITQEFNGHIWSLKIRLMVCILDTKNLYVL